MREIVLIAHNMRSCYNVGSLLRTAEGLGAFVYLTGYTPYPLAKDDLRLPHEVAKIQKQIHKTALGAEAMPIWEHSPDVVKVLEKLKNEDFTVAALEQAKDSTLLHKFVPPPKIAILLGEEVSGIPEKLLDECDTTLEIPMFGTKESFNVIQAAAMTLFYLRFTP